MMLASKKFYSTHPELRPIKKEKRLKMKPNNDIYNLLELHGGDKLKKLIDDFAKETLRVDFVNGKSVRTRKRPSKIKTKELQDEPMEEIKE